MMQWFRDLIGDTRFKCPSCGCLNERDARQCWNSFCKRTFGGGGGLTE